MAAKSVDADLERGYTECGGVHDPVDPVWFNRDQVPEYTQRSPMVEEPFLVFVKSKRERNEKPGS